MLYPFSVFQSEVENHRFWVAKSTMLKGCIGQGETQEEALQELSDNEKAWLETQEEALQELSDNEKAWLETAEKMGMNIPVIEIDRIEDYSGKMTLRIAPYVHRQAALLAKSEGISLNQYINDAIVTRNAELASAMR